MLRKLQEIILDGQNARYDAGFQRRLKMESVPGKATICIGVRRSGKTTLMFQEMQRLREQGVSPQNILYINFFDDRLRHLLHEGPGLVSEAYFALFPDRKERETVYFFFDEIQVVDGWEAFVDRLLRTEKCQVYISGSSAQMLSREIATEMRGRALTWELFPFSFKEFIEARGFDSTRPLTSRRRLFVQNAFEDFRKSGGFPRGGGSRCEI